MPFFNVRRAAGSAKETATTAVRISKVPAADVLLAWFAGGIVSSFLQRWVDGNSSVAAGAAVAAAVALTVLALLRARRHRLLTAPSVGVDGGGEKLASRKALVVLVGLESASMNAPLAQTLSKTGALEALVLIGSRETAGQGVDAAVVENLLPSCGRHLDSRNMLTISGLHADYIGDYRSATAAALAWLADRGYEGEDVVVDVSTARRSACFGALLAALDADVECQYATDAWGAGAQKDMLALKLVSSLSGGSQVTDTWQRTQLDVVADGQFISQ